MCKYICRYGPTCPAPPALRTLPTNVYSRNNLRTGGWTNETAQSVEAYPAEACPAGPGHGHRPRRPGHRSPRSRHPSRIPRSRPVSHRPRRSHLMTAGNSNRRSRSNKSNNHYQEQVTDLAGAEDDGVVAFAWGHGDGPPSGDARDRGSRTRNGPDDSRPHRSGRAPRHPPLGLGTHWSCRWVLLSRPQPHPLGGLWFCSWVETLAYPDTSHRPLGRSSRPRRGQSHESPACGPSRETLNLRRDRETRIGPPRRSSERHPTGLHLTWRPSMTSNYVASSGIIHLYEKSLETSSIKRMSM